MSKAEPIALPSSLTPRPSGDWKAAVRLGYLILVGGLGSFLLWSGFARLDAAVVASGVVAAESNRKTVQHLEGGIVQDILVRDGAEVRQGDLLIRLDPTRLDAQGDLYKNQLAILRAQEARLLAEFEAREEVTFPDAVNLRAGDAAVASVIADQRRLFQARRDAFTRNTQIADAQFQQVGKEIEQARIDVATAEQTLKQVDLELEALRPLYNRQLVPMTRIAPLERERLRLAGVVESGPVQLAKLQERRDEASLRRQQVRQDYRQEASTGLVDVRKQLSDVTQQVLLTDEGLRRSEIRSPIDGTVQQMRVFTVGGVIRPGEPILDIAPSRDDLLIQARVAPGDADRVSNGMKVEIRFPSFHYWGGAVVRGAVRSTSRDRIANEQTKDPYFAAEVLVDRSTIPPEIGERLSAGIGAEVVIPTSPRTVAGYLLSPLVDRFHLSMRER